ncbi:MAG: hypothetical protein WEB02_02750 [Methylophaga sp.]
MKKKIVLSLSITFVICLIAYSQLTLFVVQPMGAVPEGRTVVMLRLNKTNFIDSADALCERETGSVSLLCRGMMMAAVVEKSKILLRLPYFHFLYLVSTDGKEYDR